MRGTSGFTGFRLVAAGLLSWACSAHAQTDLASLSLEELSDVVITSVSRQEERLSDAAASVYVISAADIRRSGARSIPEALRLAPNLQVARVDARNYAITARGFNSPLENKLLVLIDGRSIYSPLFSGVFWDAQDVVMEDIERIEVISGPGATIWGANAVNGIINVLTRSARDSHGGLAGGAVGAHQQDAALRYGERAESGVHYRVYGKFAQADDTFDADGHNTVSGWQRDQAGFRADWEQAGAALTASGDAYQGQLRQADKPNIRIAGANLIGGVTRKLDSGASWRLQLILDHTERAQPDAIDEHLDTAELQLQHAVRVGAVHNLVWGAGYRYAWDRVVNGPSYGFLPGDMNLHWGNVFAQDEMALLPALKLTAGLKYEHDTYTGGAYLPSLRLAWNRSANQLLWGGLTRSIRAPSRIDRDLYSPTQALTVRGKPFYLVGGGPDFQSEVARTAELGYRAQPRPDWQYAVTVYATDYTRLRTLETQLGAAAAGALFGNLGKASSRGIEMWAQWQPAPYWRVNAGLVLQRLRAGLEPGSHDTSGNSTLATNDPNHHWQLRSSLDLSERWMLEAQLRHVGSLPTPAVPAYTELEAQLLWKARPDLDLALLGQNLLHPGHVEFGGLGSSVLERGLVFRLTKRF